VNVLDEKYLAGIFDAEGSIYLDVAINERYRNKIRVYPRIDIVLKVSDEYLAGLFDGDGNIMIRLQKDKSVKYGIRATPRLDIKSSSLEALLAIQRTFGGRIEIDRNGYGRWSVTNIEDVERIVNILLKHCIIKRRQLLIMKNEVLPIFKQGKHRTLEGLRKLIEIHMKKLNPKSKKRHDWFKVLEEELEKRNINSK